MEKFAKTKRKQKMWGNYYATERIESVVAIEAIMSTKAQQLQRRICI